MRIEQPLQRSSIVCVGFADWDTENWTNQRHLMSRLVRTNKMLLIESLGLRRKVDRWTPVALHWGWDALKRLVEEIAPLAVPWSNFLDTITRSQLPAWTRDT